LTDEVAVEIPAGVMLSTGVPQMEGRRISLASNIFPGYVTDASNGHLGAL
jgi:hypothetical protein